MRFPLCSRPLRVSVGQAGNALFLLDMSGRGGTQLTLSDNGRGMAPSRPGGKGIASMQARAARIGARLDTDSSETSGTEIRLTLANAVRRTAATA